MDLKSKMLDIILENAAAIPKDPEGFEVFTYQQMPQEVIEAARQNYIYAPIEETIICLISFTPKNRGAGGLAFLPYGICTNDGYEQLEMGYVCPYSSFWRYDKQKLYSDFTERSKINESAVKSLMKKLFFLTAMTDEHGEELVDFDEVQNELQAQKETYAEDKFIQYGLTFCERIITNSIFCLTLMEKEENCTSEIMMDYQVIGSLNIFWSELSEYLKENYEREYKSKKGFENYLMLCHFWSTLFYAPDEFLKLFNAEILTTIPGDLQKICLRTEMAIVEHEKTEFNMCEQLNEIGKQMLTAVQKMYDTVEDENISEEQFQKQATICITQLRSWMQELKKLVKIIISKLEEI